jgi:hypothetical protein
MIVTKDGNLLVYDKELRITNLMINPQTINEGTSNIEDLIEQVGYNEYGGVSKNIPEGSYLFNCSVFNSTAGVYSSIPLVGNYNSFQHSLKDTFFKNIFAIGDDRVDFAIGRNRDCRSMVGGNSPDYYFIKYGDLFRISKGSYYEKGSPRPEFDYRGSGNFEGKRYSDGLLFSGFSSEDKRCYINGVADAVFTGWLFPGSYCAADKLFYQYGSALPGLDSVGNGVSSGVLYIKGNPASGLVDGKRYHGGTLFTGVYMGDFERKCYIDGLPFTGLTSGKCYVAGDSETALKYYVGGLLGSGLFEGRYYQNGYGASGIFNGKLYQNGDLFNGMNGGKYYLAGVLGTGDYQGKYYLDGLLASGDVNGKYYVNGEAFTGILDGSEYQNGSKTGLSIGVNDNAVKRGILDAADAYCYSLFASNCSAGVSLAIESVCSSPGACTVTVNGSTLEGIPWSGSSTMVYRTRIDGPDPRSLLFPASTGMSNDRVVTITTKVNATNVTRTSTFILRFRLWQ